MAACWQREDGLCVLSFEFLSGVTEGTAGCFTISSYELAFSLEETRIQMSDATIPVMMKRQPMNSEQLQQYDRQAQENNNEA